MNETEAGELVVRQDPKLNQLVKEAIFQPISAESNPFHAAHLAYLNQHLQFRNYDFDFSTGLPHQLPYMLAFGKKKRQPDALAYCRPDNRRTGIITSSSGILMDEVPFNYLDEKGLGYLLEERTELSPIRREYIRVYPTNAGSLNGKPVTWGGTDLEDAIYDAKSCDGLVANGIRIVPTVAIVQIYRIPDENGKYITIDEAKEHGLIAQETVPAIQFRAYVTPYRPKEFIYTEDYHLPEKELQRRRCMLMEAFADLSQDKSIPLDFANRDTVIPAYLKWFAKTFGQTVARLHNARKVHNWLHELHNVTLDVRIIDSDGLVENATVQDIYQEMGTLFHSYPDSPCDLWKFFESIKNLFNLQTNSDGLLVLTVDSYNTELNHLARACL